jgi:signal transduction histidine kinase
LISVSFHETVIFICCTCGSVTVSHKQSLRQCRKFLILAPANGLGIPRRALKKIFRRFYQVDRSLSRHTEGRGLGLSIAKFIVDAHQGTISVDSKPSQGSTFTITLPTTLPGPS